MTNERVALVTGAGSGIGRAAALALLKDGYRVVLAGRRADALNASIVAAGTDAERALAIATDVADPSSVRALFAETRHTFGRLDVLFNNAGRGGPPVPLEDVSFEDWQAVVGVKPICRSRPTCCRRPSWPRRCRTSAAVERLARSRYPHGMSDKFRLEGLTLTVESVERSIAFYSGKLGLKVAWNAAPAFAMIRHGAGTIGLLALAEASKEGVAAGTPAQNLGIHIEFTTDDLDGLYEELKAKGVVFHAPPHDEPWERSMTALDPDGYSVEFAQGKRGENKTRA